MGCDTSEQLSAHALDALTASEVSEVEAHLEACESCRAELESLRPVVAELAAWPRNLVRPRPPLRDRLSQRLALELGKDASDKPRERLPTWENLAPMIWCQILSHDTESDLVSLLVRLEPGGEYPAHTHAAVEELHLLDGQLWIDDRLLYPGDYNRAEPGTRDTRVWSETGCTCVLITSAADLLR